MATTTQQELLLAGCPPIYFTLDSPGAALDEVDPGTLSSKRAVVINFTGGTALVRFQFASGALHVDVIEAADNTALQAAVAAMNLSGRSHPQPTADAVDTAIALAAAD